MTQSRGLASLRICNNSFLAIAAALQPHTPHMYLCNISMTGGAQGLTNVSCNLHLGLRFFICFDIKTWGTGVTSNWWLLREGGFLGRKVSNQCFFPLCSPQKAICPLTVLFSTVYSSKSHIIPYSAFFHCVLPKKPHWPLRSHMVVIQWKKAL